MFQTAISLQVEQDEDCDDLGIGQSRCAVVFSGGFGGCELMFFELSRKNFAEIVGKTIYFDNFTIGKHSGSF
jgi:hypothetical protein